MRSIISTKTSFAFIFIGILFVQNALAVSRIKDGIVNAEFPPQFSDTWPRGYSNSDIQELKEVFDGYFSRICRGNSYSSEIKKTSMNRNKMEQLLPIGYKQGDIRINPTYYLSVKIEDKRNDKCFEMIYKQYVDVSDRVRNESPTGPFGELIFDGPRKYTEDMSFIDELEKRGGPKLAEELRRDANLLLISKCAKFNVASIPENSKWQLTETSFAVVESKAKSKSGEIIPERYYICVFDKESRQPTDYIYFPRSGIPIDNP